MAGAHPSMPNSLGGASALHASIGAGCTNCTLAILADPRSDVCATNAAGFTAAETSVLMGGAPGVGQIHMILLKESLRVGCPPEQAKLKKHGAIARDTSMPDFDLPFDQAAAALHLGPDAASRSGDADSGVPLPAQAPQSAHFGPTSGGGTTSVSGVYLDAIGQESVAEAIAFARDRAPLSSWSTLALHAAASGSIGEAWIGPAGTEEWQRMVPAAHSRAGAAYL